MKFEALSVQEKRQLLKDNGYFKTELLMNQETQKGYTFDANKPLSPQIQEAIKNYRSIIEELSEDSDSTETSIFNNLHQQWAESVKDKTNPQLFDAFGNIVEPFKALIEEETGQVIEINTKNVHELTQLITLLAHLAEHKNQNPNFVIETALQTSLTGALGSLMWHSTKSIGWAVFDRVKKTSEATISATYNYAADKGTSAYNLAASTGSAAYDMTARASKATYDRTAEASKAAYAMTAQASTAAFDMTAKASKATYNKTAQVSKAAFDMTAQASKAAYDMTAKTGSAAYGVAAAASTATYSFATNAGSAVLDSATTAGTTAYEYAAEPTKKLYGAAVTAGVYALETVTKANKSAVGSTKSGVSGLYQKAQQKVSDVSASVRLQAMELEEQKQNKIMQDLMHVKQREAMATSEKEAKEAIRDEYIQKLQEFKDSHDRFMTISAEVAKARNDESSARESLIAEHATETELFYQQVEEQMQAERLAIQKRIAEEINKLPEAETQAREDLNTADNDFRKQIQEGQKQAILKGFSRVINTFATAMKQNYKPDSKEALAIDNYVTSAETILNTPREMSLTELKNTLSNELKACGEKHFSRTPAWKRVLADVLMCVVFPIGAIVAATNYAKTGHCFFSFDQDKKTRRQTQLEQDLDNENAQNAPPSNDDKPSGSDDEPSRSSPY